MAGGPPQVSNEDQTLTLGNILVELTRHSKLLRRLVGEKEQPGDYDQAFGLSFTAAPQVVVVQVPRTLKHVELTISIAYATAGVQNALFVFSGQLTSVQALGSIAGPGQSAHTVASSGGQVRARDYLDGTGYITVLCQQSGAGNLYGTLRVRSLDRSALQPRTT